MTFCIKLQIFDGLGTGIGSKDDISEGLKMTLKNSKRGIAQGGLYVETRSTLSHNM